MNTDWWANLDELEQFNILNATYQKNAKQKIVTDILLNSENFKLIKGKINKRLVLKNINFYDYSFKLFSQLYNYCPDVDYTYAIQHLLNRSEYAMSTVDSINCSKELFDYIINNIGLLLINGNATNNFFIIFKHFLSKEIMINISNNLPVNFYYMNIVYEYAEKYFKESFKQQLEFINKIQEIH